MKKTGERRFFLWYPTVSDYNCHMKKTIERNLAEHQEVLAQLHT